MKETYDFNYLGSCVTKAYSNFTKKVQSTANLLL